MFFKLIRYVFYTFPSEAIKHVKLSQPSAPCTPAPGYSLTRCVERSVMARAGCQPPWTRSPGGGDLPVCDNMVSLKKYQEEFKRNIYNNDRNGIIKATKCLVPCSFIEYKVTDGVECIRLTIYPTDDGGPDHNTNRRFLHNLRCPLHRFCGGSEGGGGLLLPQPRVRLWRRARPVHWIQLSDGRRLYIYLQCKPFKVTINISYHRCRVYR